MSNPNLNALVESVDQININDSNNTNTNMPNPTQEIVNYPLLRLYLDSIPLYDGNPHTLNVSIENCESLLKNFVSTTDNKLNDFLLRAIMGKLTGRALILIGSRIEITSWNEIRDALTLCFGDQRNLDCLIQDLINLRPHKNETPYNFGMRCQDARSLVISKLNTLPYDAAVKRIHMQNYNELSLKTYIRGLTGQLQTNVRLRNPDSLESAMSFVIEEENFLYSTQKPSSINLQHTFRPAQRLTPLKPTNYFQNQPTYLPSFPTNNQFTMRPQQPQNFNTQHYFAQPPKNNYIRPNQFSYTQQHANTHRSPFSQMQQNNHSFNRPMFNSQQNQNFNRPMFNTQNKPMQFKPNFQNQSFNQNKPYKAEPMDTSSGNTRIKPKFVSTELFAQNIDQSEFENPFETQQSYNEHPVESNETCSFETYQEERDFIPYDAHGNELHACELMQQHFYNAPEFQHDIIDNTENFTMTANSKNQT